MNFDKARHNMVTQQVRSWDVINKDILNAMLNIQREEFVQVAQRKLAFADLNLPIGNRQSMMKPVIEGRMLQAINPDKTLEVLEVGTGSAYVTALLAHLCHHVTSIDCHASFVQSAQVKLKENNINNVTLIEADFYAFDNQQKFDRVVITGGLSSVPDFVFNWLKPNGEVFAIVGKEPIMEARIYKSSNDYKAHFDTTVEALSNIKSTNTFEL
ncbi:protein-L-isoaspartate O-methyltransferase family protein [Marinicella rhabdoformis]|uniref:protein-L-isoaspartate O-methyltransferase family protein n=1 Tax=Marinicella rhabdoformis TaxID=2580566 RepID=UPI0012AEC485|nr:protein-L-isoaspartate O-methyltransferase [Marinicella rhabdoformis]